MSTQEDVVDSQAVASAFERLCLESWLPIYRIVSRSCRSRSDAEELTQEVFARALAAQKGASISEMPSEAYLARIAQNLVIDGWRSANSAPSLGPLDVSMPSAEEGPEAATEAREERQALLVALDSLPDRYYQVLRLRLHEGLSPLEVGTLMKISSNAVRQLQFRAVQALREKLGLMTEGSP